MKSSDFSKNLRKSQTKTEKVIWSKLRSRQFFDIKFRRQHIIGPYTVDFYAPNLKLVIEIDGDVHDLPLQRVADQKREFYLNQLGLTVFHINNDDIYNNLDAVLEKLRTLTISLAARSRP